MLRAVCQANLTCLDRRQSPGRPLPAWSQQAPHSIPSTSVTSVLYPAAAAAATAAVQTCPSPLNGQKGTLHSSFPQRESPTLWGPRTASPILGRLLCHISSEVSFKRRSSLLRSRRCSSAYIPLIYPVSPSIRRFHAAAP